MTDQPVQSPCTNICRIDPGSGLCAGCLRTLDEIAEWGEADEARRRMILDALEGRRLLWAAQGNLRR